MEFGELLLGIEPMTALVVGVGTLVLAPVVSAVVGSAMGVANTGESISESARELTKKGLVLGFEAVENLQTAYARTEQAVRDVWVDAMIEHMAKKSKSEKVEPRRIEIVE